MGTELIMGMEEVINYLKELEAKNKKLEEELETCRKVRFSVSEMCQELREEKKKLKEENYTLFHKADHWELKYHTLTKLWRERSEQLRRINEDSDDEEITEPESDKP